MKTAEYVAAVKFWNSKPEKSIKISEEVLSSFRQGYVGLPVYNEFMKVYAKALANSRHYLDSLMWIKNYTELAHSQTDIYDAKYRVDWKLDLIKLTIKYNISLAKTYANKLKDDEDLKFVDVYYQARALNLIAIVQFLSGEVQYSECKSLIWKAINLGIDAMTLSVSLHNLAVMSYVEQEYYVQKVSFNTYSKYRLRKSKITKKILIRI